MEQKELAIEVELNPTIKITEHYDITHIRISVEHDRGGKSIYTGEVHETGIIVRVTPIHKTDNGFGVMYDGQIEHQGFYIYCMPCIRKSPKKMEAIADKVFSVANGLSDLFLQGNYKNILEIINNIVKELNFNNDNL